MQTRSLSAYSWFRMLEVEDYSSSNYSYLLMAVFSY